MIGDASIVPPVGKVHSSLRLGAVEGESCVSKGAVDVRKLSCRYVGQSELPPFPASAPPSCVPPSDGVPPPSGVPPSGRVPPASLVPPPTVAAGQPASARSRASRLQEPAYFSNPISKEASRKSS